MIWTLLSKKHSIFSLLLFLLFSTNCQKAQPSSPEALAQLRKNVIGHILSAIEDDNAVTKVVATLNDEGTWPDIDYTSQQRGGWEPAGHLNRLLTMAQAYRTPQSFYYRNAGFSKKIHLALDYWLDHDPICPNWWYPEIGVPMRLSPTLFLMEEELSTEQKVRGIKILDRAKIGKTGQNKVWLSGNVLFKSLLLGDEAMIRKAAASIREELRVEEGEGIQPDWSFHQHGPQLQFGNYGLSYASSMIQWITILKNTPFQFEESKIALLRNYLLDGQQWVSWKQMMDISACGRQLFVDSPVSKATSLAASITKMTTLDSVFAEDYKRANKYTSLVGNKHFWRSDFQVHRTPEYYFSIKMCSERVGGAESCNSENLQGYHMGDGAAFLFQTGQEYENIFPFWNWKRVPGTTIHQNEEPLPILSCSGYHIETDFVGGVSDGKTGIAVLDYNRDGLTAKKSWFVFDDIIACLGAGITSSEGDSVTTSVNQIFQEGDTWIKEETEKKFPDGSADLQNPPWVWHNHTGYFFPKGGNLKLETGLVSGSWNTVASRYPDKKEEANLFQLWLEHGVNPSAESYAYFILPHATIKDLVRMESIRPFEILQNDEKMQAIVSRDSSVAGIVFYQTGEADLFGGIEVDQPCLVMLKKEKGSIKVSISDPTQKLKKIRLSLNGSFSLTGKVKNVAFDTEKSVLTVTLPSGGKAGKTVSLSLKKR